MSVGMMT